MRNRPFKQVDVFTSVPMLGNPVAVLLDAEGLSDADMRRIANWTNLSETTFVLPATETAADYRVRIFTPQSELPFAGHPTLGTAHAVIKSGLAVPRGGKLVQQCGIGLVDIQVLDEGLSFRLPRYDFAPAPEPAALANAIGGTTLIKGDPEVVDVGPRWVVAELGSAAAVDRLAPDLSALAAYDRAHQTSGLTVFATGDADAIVVRTFAPAHGISEDPVCGSGNGAVAAYRLKAGQVGDGSRYTASQGRQLGRDGRVSVRIEGRAVHVGGAAVTCIEGVFLA